MARANAIPERFRGWADFSILTLIYSPTTISRPSSQRLRITRFRLAAIILVPIPNMMEMIRATMQKTAIDKIAARLEAYALGTGRLSLPMKTKTATPSATYTTGGINILYRLTAPIGIIRNTVCTTAITMQTIIVNLRLLVSIYNIHLRSICQVKLDRLIDNPLTSRKIMLLYKPIATPRGGWGDCSHPSIVFLISLQESNFTAMV
jgi:hypothetical protein